MAPKAHSLFKCLLFFFLMMMFIQNGCKTKNISNNISDDIVFEQVDTSHIPAIAINRFDERLASDNGIYLLSGKAFSGHVVEYYQNKKIKSNISVYNGMLHGVARTYYPDGKINDVRSYKMNKAYGRHYGFWEDGKQKFDYTYYNDKEEGEQKQWYKSGQLYLRLHYKNDKETGLQQGWRENGKLFINYEVKDGIRYGLQKTYLCYKVKNEQVK